MALLRAAAAEPPGSDAAESAALSRLESGPPSSGELQSVAARLREERVFDLLPLRLQARLDSDPIHQVHHLEGDRIHTVTTVRFPGVDPERLEQVLVGEPWDWWKGGRVSHWTRTPDGGTKFILWPVWLRSPARVGIELSPAKTEEESILGAPRRRRVVAARFFQDFEGPGAYEVLEARGGSVLRAIWSGVRRQGVISILPVPSVLNIHLGAERGSLRFPFRSGTGYPGLLSKMGATELR